MPSTRRLIAAFALGRIAFGAGLVLAPERIAGGWIGDDAGRRAAQVVVRGLGARDIALSAGALLSSRGNGDARPWLLVTAASDCVDVAATIAAGDSLPERAQLGTVLLAGGSALAGVALARAI
jgi:hypothetical protein